ncbi:MAG: two-component sensor histidine kinase [Deltaproteobacteria bacterium HGW-Deltaproteobacteria-15]|jgi:heavy metal sensor kinase|nr:MAG: two-component sensor histidine kinase [Deltaproteobacteria bacterium HGW-Deltaproteobacteria-15]
MRILSIRARLTLWYSSLLALTLLLLGGVCYGLLSYSLARDVDASLNSVARALEERSHGRGSFPPSEVDEVFRRFFGFSPWERYFGMFDPGGRMDSGSGKLRLSPKARKNAAEGRFTFETIEGIAEYPVRILTRPVIRGGRLVNLIQVGMSLQNTESTKRTFLFTLAAVFPVALLLAGGGGWLLARRALSPVDRMAEAARKISVENLAERLSDPGKGDELSRLARTLNEMLDRLENSFHQVRRFSADASHELQTPLTILKGEMEVALRMERSPEEYRRILESGLEEIDRISRLVDGLLLLARSEARALKMDLQPVDLLHLVQEVHGHYKEPANSRNVTLALGPLSPLSAQGDKGHLRRALVNLVDNAIKYTPDGGRVTLSLEQRDGRACLIVEDTGIGIPEEEQSRIFERFYRSQAALSMGEGGHGLGLCIARSIVETHGGRIEIDSAPGRGSTFALLLPLVTLPSRAWSAGDCF